jgi:hypothetical protein
MVVSANGGTGVPDQSERLAHGHGLADSDGRRTGDHVSVDALHVLSVHYVVDDNMRAVSATVCEHRAYDAGAMAPMAVPRPGKRSTPL